MSKQKQAAKSAAAASKPQTFRAMIIGTWGRFRGQTPRNLGELSSVSLRVEGEDDVVILDSRAIRSFKTLPNIGEEFEFQADQLGYPLIAGKRVQKKRARNFKLLTPPHQAIADEEWDDGATDEVAFDDDEVL